MYDNVHRTLFMNCTVRVNVKFRKLYTNLRIIKKICEQQLDRMSAVQTTVRYNQQSKQQYAIMKTL